MGSKGLSDQTVEKHESYGIVGIHRTSSSGTYLFGSLARHHSFISLRIQRGEKHRHLANDWYHANEQLVEIEMTHEQFGRLISSPDMGDGVPCTIRAVGHEMMEPCPEPESMTSKFSGDLKATTKETVAELVALRNQLNEALLPGNKPLGKTEQRELLAKINSALMSITDSIPFIEKSFGEELKREQNKAIAELESVAASLIHKTGLNALSKANEMLEAERALPEFPRPQLGTGEEK